MKDFLSCVLEKETLFGTKEHIHRYDLLNGFYADMTSKWTITFISGFDKW